MRYAGQAKMGYYPTPVTQTEKILRKLAFTGPCRLYDPCCGEGVALVQVGQAAPPGSRTYGVELDGARAEEAKQRLDEVRACSYSYARVERNTMQLLWLNPPYDSDSGAAAGSDRVELRFLRDLTKQGMLQAGGVLVYIIPRTILTETLVNTLCIRFTDLGCYRFDDDEYGAFSQVVLFGVRRTESISRLTADEACIQRLLLRWGVHETGQPLATETDPDAAPVMALPTLDEEDDRIWTVPHTDTDAPILFRGYVLSEEELRLDADRSGIFDVATRWLQTALEPTVLARPPLPFRRMHMATLIAAGALDGAIGRGEGRHLLTGAAKKVMSVTETVNPETGKVTIISTESYTTTATVVVEDGTILDLV